MIEARTTGESKPQTPEVITTSMILGDLENGIDRKGIQEKYGLQTWEVTEMFKHPVLQGRRPKKKRTLSFTFVDDTNEVIKETVDVVEDTPQAEETVDENQITLEEAIEVAEQDMEEVVDTVEEEITIDEEEEDDFNFEL